MLGSAASWLWATHGSPESNSMGFHLNVVYTQPMLPLPRLAHPEELTPLVKKPHPTDNQVASTGTEIVVGEMAILAI